LVDTHQENTYIGAGRRVPKAIDALLLIGHGTVDDLNDMAAFLSRIRMGRPASPELIAEITARYRRIGGSPLRAISVAQALALEERLKLPCLLAARMWHPRLEDVVVQAHQAGYRRLLALPLAPFSVDLYHRSAVQAASDRGLTDMVIEKVAPWGSHARYVGAWADQIRPFCEQIPDAALLLTAHSLPTRVIRAGDRYQQEVEACASAIAQILGKPHRMVFQSQGADGGEWVGPSLQEALQRLKSENIGKAIVAPIGFLSDHVETLYDLDIEAAHWAQDLGIAWHRVPALNATPAMIDTLETVARDAGIPLPGRIPLRG
jgi:ferrochelatase